jgi:citrate synthase
MQFFLRGFRRAAHPMAVLTGLVAMTCKSSIGQPVVCPQNNLSHTENVMHRMFATPGSADWWRLLH